MTFASMLLNDAKTDTCKLKRSSLVFYLLLKNSDNLFVDSWWLRVDHKPLIALSSKHLNDGTLKTQQIMIEQQKYVLAVTYTPRKHLFATDVLSQDIPPVGVTKKNL